MTANTAADFGPAAILAELQAKATEAGEATTGPLPDRLPTASIRRYPALFQPRGEDERHIQELRRAIRNVGDLEAVVVLQIGAEAVLVDGHHRCDAYEAEGITRPVPIRVFKGTVEEAVLEAGRSNSKAKLTMTTQERMDYAWRLVRIGDNAYSKKKIMDAAAVSEGQVSNMRRVKRELGEEAYEYEQWWRAREVEAGRAPVRDFDDDEREAWLNAQADTWADAIHKATGTKLANNPEVAARTLERVLGRKLPDVMAELRDYLPDEDDDDEQTDF